MQDLLHFSIGIGLAAACGFRISVPILIMGIAARTGDITLSPGFDWIGSWEAITTFGVASLLEVTAYCIPWVDHLLDVVASPASIVAGTLVTAAMVGDMSPCLRWSLAAIAGGGSAAIFQTATVSLRGLSGVFTGGLGNCLVSILELFGSIVMACLAVIAPIVGLVLAVGLGAIITTTLVKRLNRTPRGGAATSTPT
jgi:hypothetical protein